MFHSPNNRDLTSLPLSQLYLDHLLALSMLQADERWAEGRFIVMYPEINESVRDGVRDYQRQLSDSSSFGSVTLEDAVDHLLTLTDAAWAREFRARYLDSWPVTLRRGPRESRAVRG